MPKNQKKALTWLDNNILLVLGGLLVAFIPLYPKLPLFEAIPGYIVRVRLEDLVILATALIWFIQLLRRKVSFKTPLTPLIIAYAVVGLLSTLSAVVITKTVPVSPLHIGKTLLHYFRYLEYFSLFFILSSAVKNRRDLKVLLVVMALTLVGVGIYGFGQKYYYWPVYSTMNREFSKGVRLYLTEHARVQSTFGGHYDLAAYLVILLPLLLALYYGLKKKSVKFLVFVAFLLGLWLLVTSASRTSFAAFFLGALAVVLLFAWQRKRWLERIAFTVTRYGGLLAICFLMLVSFGDDMYERLLQVLEGYPAVYKPYMQAAKTVSGTVNELAPVIKEIPFFTAEKPENGLSTEDAEVLVASDQRPVEENPKDLPSDVYVIVPDVKKVATISATGQIEIIEVQTERTYSPNALRYGLSLAIRLDELWPKALKGFYRNPALGSGYATLTKDSTIHFTEAESTDNNYLRVLGETGLLGFLTFYGTIAAAMYWAYRLYKKNKNKNFLYTALAVGYIGASVALLFNATYIDVYAASKVALTYWALTGIVLAVAMTELPESREFLGKFDLAQLKKKLLKK